MKTGANEKYHLFPVYLLTENLKGLFYFSKIDVKMQWQRKYCVFYER